MVKRIGKIATIALAAVWATFVFVASNSPTDVQERAQGWLALPIIRDVPDAFVAFASNPSTLILTFLGIGLIAGWLLKGWWTARQSFPWWETLGVEMSLMAMRIENMGYSNDDIHSFNADLDVLRIAAEKRGFPFPKFSDGFKTTESLRPYLSRVSAHLKAGNIDHARVAARDLSAKPSN